MAEISIIAYGDGVCINDYDRNPYGTEKYGLCAYCSGSSVWNKSNAVASQIKDWADWDKLEKTLDSNPIVKKAIENEQEITFNIWGANPDTPSPIAEGMDSPLERSQAIADFVEDYCKERDLKHAYFISTNGFWIADEKVQAFYYDLNKKAHVTLQLSHDGLGNYVRQGKFDPLFDKETGLILAQMCRDGIFTFINVTMTRQNNSFFADMAMINKWRFDNNLMDKTFNVKLNHINDSPYCDHWNLKGKALNTYMNELETIFLNMRFGNTNGNYWVPYISYFENQSKRYDPYRQDGSCGMYSNFINGNEPNDPIFKRGRRIEKKYNWSINTLGEYVVCQLIDKPEDVPNPHQVRLENCETCEYGWMDECHPCPDNIMNPDCQYKKEYARLMLRMRVIDDYLKQHNQGQKCSCK